MRNWLLIMALVVLAGIIIPYGVLGGGAPGLAIGIFWLIFGVVVAGLIAFAVMRWRDDA